MQIAKVGNQLGIDIEGLPESEQFEALSNELVLEKSQQMSGALSNADMDFLLNTVPRLSNTKEGRAQMLNFAKRLQQREINYAKAAQQFRKDNDYFNLSEFQSEYNQYSDMNPLFDEEAPVSNVVEWGDL